MRETAKDRQAAINPATNASGPSAVDLQLVCFLINGQEYGMAASRVQEIMRPTRFYPTKGNSYGVIGSLHSKDNSCPVIDLRALLGVEAGSFGEATRIVVFENRGRQLGLIADEVTEVLRVDGACMEIIGQDEQKTGDSFWTHQCRLDDRMIRILDLDKIAPCYDKAPKKGTDK